MLLRFVFIQYIIVASATHEYVEKYTYSHYLPFQDFSDELQRNTRLAATERIAPEAPTCAHMKLTQALPFVALMLYRTSGRFLGMGSILDRETILTAQNVVKKTVEDPSTLLALAGRLNPWWGDGSQVYPARFIYANELGVAVVRLVAPLTFNKYVKAIRLITNNPMDYAAVFTRHWAIVGIPRGAWNVPGEPIGRTSIFVMKVETEVMKKDEKDACAASFPDVEMNSSVHTCTIANYSFGWGCQGSPTVAVDKQKKLHQIAVVTEATRKTEEPYHIHVKLGLLLNWIKAHTHTGFLEESDK